MFLRLMTVILTIVTIVYLNNVLQLRDNCH